MLRFVLLLAFALAGCTTPVFRQSDSVAPASPILPPATTAAAAWLLSSAEVEYVALFRFAHERWTAAAMDALVDVAGQYRDDPGVLKDNRWRVQATETADQLDGAYLWFNPASPSERFDRFEAEMRRAVERSEIAASALRHAVDENDGLGVEQAVREMQTMQAELDAIAAAFDGMIPLEE